MLPIGDLAGLSLPCAERVRTPIIPIKAVGSLAARALMGVPRHARSFAGDHQLCICSQIVPGVGIAIPAREAAAGDVQADTMPLLEYIAGHPQVDLVRYS